jgi:membrane associated rhomboid family serine protease
MPLTNRNTSFSNFVPSLTSAVKALLVVNVGIFLLEFVAVRAGFFEPFQLMGLVPQMVVTRFAIWQLFTYMFLHDPQGVSHILLNMLMLWMFGPPIEGIWGRKRFVTYYIYCGLGAGASVVLLNYLMRSPASWTIGASGALYGILIAFGILYAETTILFMFIFPMKAKWAALIYGAIAFLFTFGSTGGSTSHVAHLGGFVTGYLLLKTGSTRSLSINLNPMPTLRQYHKDWKFRRAKKKFQVYLKKSGGDRGPWVN